MGHASLISVRRATIDSGPLGCQNAIVQVLICGFGVGQWSLKRQIEQPLFQFVEELDEFRRPVFAQAGVSVLL